MSLWVLNTRGIAWAHNWYIFDLVCWISRKNANRKQRCKYNEPMLPSSLSNVQEQSHLQWYDLLKARVVWGFFFWRILSLFGRIMEVTYIEVVSLVRMPQKRWSKYSIDFIVPKCPRTNCIGSRHKCHLALFTIELQNEFGSVESPQTVKALTFASVTHQARICARPSVSIKAKVVLYKHETNHIFLSK